MYKILGKEKTFEITLDNSDTNIGVIDGSPFKIDMSKDPSGRIHIIKNDKGYTVEVIEANLQTKSFIIKVNGRKYSFKAEDRFDSLLKKLGMENMANLKVKDIKAPMPGLVLDVMVEDNQTISKGDAVLVLEAMKMENIIKSPTDGIVKSIEITKGNAVEKNEVLINFK